MAAVIYCLRCLVGRDIPLNQGCLAPVKVCLLSLFLKLPVFEKQFRYAFLMELSSIQVMMLQLLGEMFLLLNVFAMLFFMLLMLLPLPRVV
jgi:hypothetical protein